MKIPSFLRQWQLIETTPLDYDMLFYLFVINLAWTAEVNTSSMDLQLDRVFLSMC